MDYVGSKTRSQGQMLEKPCVRSRGHIFCSITMKRFDNVYLVEISDEFDSRSCRVINLITRSNFRKKPFVRSRGHIFSPIIMKLGQNVCLDKISPEFENGLCQGKI